MPILRPLLLALLLSPLTACYDLYTRPAGAPDEPTDMPIKAPADGPMPDVADPAFVQKSYTPSLMLQESIAVISNDTKVMITSYRTDSETYIKCYFNTPDSTEWKERCKFERDSIIPVGTSAESGFLAAFLPSGLLLVARKETTMGTKEYALELYSTKDISQEKLSRVKSNASPLKLAVSKVRTIRLSSDAQRIFVETYPDNGAGNLSQVVSVNTPQATP